MILILILRISKSGYFCDITCQVTGRDDVAPKLKAIMNKITQFPITAHVDFFFFAHSMNR